MIPRYRSPLALADVIQSIARCHAPLPASFPGLPNGKALGWRPSASQALYDYLRGGGSPGYVVMPAYTCIRVVTAVQLAGWTPRFVDVDPRSLCVDPRSVSNALTQCKGRSVVLATHLHGFPMPLSDLREVTEARGALLLEDAAMAQGAIGVDGPVGTGSDAAIFSYGLGKSLGFGGGGVLVGASASTRTERREHAASMAFAIASRAGWLGGLRFRLQEAVKRLPGVRPRGGLEAAFEPETMTEGEKTLLQRLAGLPKLEAYLQSLRDESLRWLEWLDGLKSPHIFAPRPVAGSKPCSPLLPMVVEDPQRLAGRLRRIGVDTARYFDYSAAAVAGDQGSYPGAELLSRRILLLPVAARTSVRAKLVEEEIARYAKGL